MTLHDLFTLLILPVIKIGVQYIRYTSQYISKLQIHQHFEDSQGYGFYPKKTIRLGFGFFEQKNRIRHIALENVFESFLNIGYSSLIQGLLMYPSQGFLDSWRFCTSLREGYQYVLVLHLELIYEVSSYLYIVQFLDFNFSYICSLCILIYNYLCLPDLT